MSASLPLVSVVTPSFNQGAFLQRTMDSVFAQDYPNVEYILVDGGSTDGSVDTIRRNAARLAWWVSEADAGQADAINKGLARAHGSILAWLNSDDTWEPSAVASAVAAFARCEDCGLIYGAANYIDAQDKVVGRFPSALTDYRRLRQGYVHIPQQAAFFRSEIWRAVAPLDPSFYFAMDYDLWVRIAKRAPIRYVPEVWGNFRIHNLAKTIAADERCWPEMLRVHYREGGSFFSSIVAKSYLRRLVSPVIRWRRARMLARAG